MTVTIYHNPRCSKSRQTLALLEEKGIAPEVVEYLKDVPTKAQLADILKMLGMSSARDLMRKKEAEYKDNGLDDDSLSEDQLLDALVKHPKLIERPIVIKGGKAAIGRPPEAVLDVL
ncbi:arsenate reductase (glutaredoxin) [Emcibacter nanhaiensis]|uniref:Arsenate reductase n=1 Tax=Emcibacter nanhaiensis TaxID=1505037 RepID=A0A501PIA6_9PROT|nr:arsenate reductase (glutaredoxin) [Emcibacter nanhaiensis]TPD59752.1 arsenate reductase (glutaredoxin) [Emcibacter nanhaiensis]